MVFFILFTILLGMHIYSVLAFKNANNYHPIVRILTGVIVVVELSVFCYMLHYLVFTFDGVGMSFVSALASCMRFSLCCVCCVCYFCIFFLFVRDS